MDSPQASPTSYGFDYILLSRIDKMMDSEAEGEQDKYFINFKNAIRLLLPHLNIKTRTAVEDDYKKLEQAVKEVRENKELNEETRKTRIREYRSSFGDKHSVYIFASLSRVGVIKIPGEGKIDFTELELDQMAAIVQGRAKGLQGTIEAVVKPTEPKQEPKAGAP